MSEERVISNASALDEEDRDGVEDERPVGCFQTPSLCCCLPKRRMSLPGRRPKDRKKNNGKKNIDVPSLDDIMFKEKQQNKDQDNWSLTSAGDLGSVHIKNRKPTLTLCTQLQDKKSQDSHIPLLLKDIYLEEKPGYDDKTNANTQTKECKQKVVLDDFKISSLETEKKCSVGGASEGEGHLVTPVNEIRVSEKPDLKAALEEVDYEKEQKEGGDHINGLLDAMSCKEEVNQAPQDVPLEDLQVSRELEFNSMLTANEKMTQEEQSTGTDTEGVNSLLDLLNQPSVLPAEEEKCGGQQEFATDVTCNKEEQIRGSKLDSLSEGDTHKEDQNVQGKLKNEAQKPTELKYPEILSTMYESREEEKAGVQQHLHIMTEASSTSLEQNCINLLDQEDQPPVIPQSINFPCQSTSCEKQQKEILTTSGSTSNNSVINVEDHQYIPHHFHQQTALPEKIILPQDEDIKDLQLLDNINYLIEDNAVHVSEQKHAEIQQLVSLEQISIHHHGKGNEQHEEPEYDHSGCKVTAYNEEEENQEPIVSEDFTKLPSNINFEREQQRKLDCGDSGPEGICDKEEQDCQDALGLEVQQPLIISKLTTLPLNTSEEMPCEKKDHGNLDAHSLDEDPEKQDGQCQMHVSAPPKEEAAALEPDEKWLTLSLLTEDNKKGEQVESCHIPKGVSLPHEEQPQKVERNLDLCCEKQQQKEKQDLSNITFTGDVAQDETLI